MNKFRFGSFNMKNLSKGVATKRDFSQIRNIINSEKLDIVALQEVLSEGAALEYLLKYSMKDWAIKWAEPRESSDPSKARDKRGEGYAFMWNTKRFKLASSATDEGERVYEPRIVSDALRFDSSLFARCPYYARFVPVNGGFFEFRLLNVHLHFGDNSLSEIEKRKEEFNFLIDRVYPAVSRERRYGNNREAYTIVMGDYNLNIDKPRGKASERINKHTYIPTVKELPGMTVVTVQDELTTLKNKEDEFYNEDNNPDRGYSQNYDHFSFDREIFDRENIRYKYRRVDAVRKYCNDDFDLYRAEISDHVPIIIEITMNESGARTSEFGRL